MFNKIFLSSDHGGFELKEKVKILQEALISLGYDLGLNGPFSNGIDGQYGKQMKTIHYQREGPSPKHSF